MGDKRPQNQRPPDQEISRMEPAAKKRGGWSRGGFGGRGGGRGGGCGRRF